MYYFCLSKAGILVATWSFIAIVSLTTEAFQINFSRKEMVPRLRLQSKRSWFTNILSGKRMKKPQDYDYLVSFEENIEGKRFRPKEGSIGETAVMMESFKKAQNVAKRTELMAQELRKAKIDGVSSNGQVKVYFDGQQNPLGVDIDENFLNDIGSSKALSDAITEAIQDAHKKSRAYMKDKMQSLYSEIGLPTM